MKQSYQMKSGGKRLGDHAKVTWEMVKKCVPYNPQAKRCLLCLNEKLSIAAHTKLQLIEQQKRNRIKMSTPAEVRTS